MSSSSSPAPIPAVDSTVPVTVAPSATPSTDDSAFDPARVDEYNAYLSTKSPQEILEWSIDHLPGLSQTSALGITGTAAIAMIAQISKRRKQPHLVPLIFIDTLYHFQETVDLAHEVAKKYKIDLHVYYPPGVSTTAEFEAKYGEKLWETDEDTYDYLVKVEPARRAYDELDVKAAITGRRATQGADRASLQPLEIDSTGLVKVNPLFNWTFQDVKDYIDMAGVPYNPLLDRGYKSVGDWHSTVLPKEGESERSGRWASNKTKTECGLHKDYFAMKRAFEKKQLEQTRADADKARGEHPDEVGESSVDLDGKAEDLGASFSDLKLGA
ncbi:hypothetical protein JCM11251_007591 [Rhodosporidiobolus azoricus]